MIVWLRGLEPEKEDQEVMDPEPIIFILKYK